MSELTSSAESAYETAHINDDKRPLVLEALIICLAIAYVATFLRFLSRRLVRTTYEADDWWILLGLVE